MTRDEFLAEMQNILQTEETLTVDTLLDDLVEWDSLSMMSTLAFLAKNFGIDVGLRDFKEMSTIGDIAVKAGIA